MNLKTSRNKKLGFTLSETLIAILLMSIVLAAITTGIVAAKNSYEKIVVKADALTLLSTVSLSVEGDLGSATNIASSDIDVTLEDGSTAKQRVYTFTSGLRGYNMYFDNRNDMVSAVIPGPENIVIPVASDKAHTSKLRSEITFNNDYMVDKYFVYTITIRNKEDNKVLAQQLYKIKPGY